ncbi:hypothetical protein Lser_V15G19821 [Lactuca serriola]
MKSDSEKERQAASRPDHGRHLAKGTECLRVGKAEDGDGRVRPVGR